MMLSVESINTYYGSSHILHDNSFTANAEETVAILGRNGAGKTTAMRSIMGLTPPRSGTIRFRDEVISGKPSHVIANLGVGFVPQNREMFPALSVRENLRMGFGRSPASEERIEEMYEWFPRLGERRDQRAGTLSGGEQQMVAIARAIISDPALVLMDEPTEGLMPKLIPRIGEIIEDMKAAGYTIMLVEQNVDLVLDVADRIYILENGRIEREVTPAELESQPELAQQYLGV